jgi:prepilin-type N-terminal cleavage/methylation domain-containing protein
MKRTVLNKGGRSRGAFTLIEIMVVVGILGIVLAMGVPPFVRIFQKDPLRQAVSDITEACSKARAQAILQGAPAALVVRAADGQVSVVSAPDARGDETSTRDGSTEPSTAAGTQGSSVFNAHLHEDVAITLLYVNLKNQMEAEESRVHFYSNGTSDEFAIVLQTGAGIRKISLECVTGLANVEIIR